MLEEVDFYINTKIVKICLKNMFKNKYIYVRVFQNYINIYS